MRTVAYLAVGFDNRCLDYEICEGAAGNLRGSTHELVGLRFHAELPTISCSSYLRHTCSVRTMYVHVNRGALRDSEHRSASSKKVCDLQELWRRRESNPRPRTHRTERLQA